MIGQLNEFHIKIDDMLPSLTNSIIFWLSKDNHLLGCNAKLIQQLSEFSNISSYEDIIGKKCDEFLGKDAVEMVEKENKIVIETKTALQFLNTWVIPNFKKITFLTMKTPFYDSDHNIVGIFGIAHYLSEHYYNSDQNIELSKREAECIEYLLKGKTNKEIAHLTGLSQRTIESYFDNIKNKLNCNSRSELISIGLNMAPFGKVLPPFSTSESYVSGIFTALKDENS